MTDLDWPDFLAELNKYNDLTWLEAYGVYARQSDVHPDKYSLNYDQLEAKGPWDIFCRGTIVIHRDNKWQIIAYPLKRFFNLGDPRGVTLENLIGPVVMQDKLDGTMMIGYHYPTVDGEYVPCWATRSVPDANLPCADGMTYAEKITSVNTIVHQPGRTYIYELIGPFNQHVVHYKTNEAILLVIFNEQGQDIYTGTVTQKLVSLDQILDTWDTVKEAPGTQREGVVIVDTLGQRIKLKTLNYLAAFRSLSRLATPSHYLDLILSGGEDDILPILSDHQQETLKDMMDKTTKYFHQLTELQKHYISNYQDRKTKALEIQKHDHKIWMGYLILDTPTSFFDWVTSRCITDTVRKNILSNL